MTHEEFLALKEGDRVEVHIRGSGWRPARVKATSPVHKWLWVVHRSRAGNVGHTSLTLSRNGHSERIRHPSDPVKGHVYADYLEENGQPEAARMLREAFPLA